MTEPFDRSKHAQTRDGRPVRILCTDAKGDYPICGLVLLPCGTEVVSSWAPDGRIDTASIEVGEDLINVPTKRKGWIGVEPALRGERIALTSNVCPSEAQVRESTCNSFAQYIEIEFDE